MILMKFTAVMGKAAFIFTTDYEIFGNGSGCVEKCIIEPTDRMAAILEKVGAKLTIFLDVCEYWAFEEEFAKGKLKKNWAGLIRNQLQNLVERGHDVQLHVHPQWMEYSYDGSSWSLNLDHWRTGKLPYESSDHPKLGLKNLFARGKETLEHMICPIKPDYRCEVFRAGAWSIQPEEKVLEAMLMNGFKIDSTVAPGLKFADDYTYYDFSAAPFHKQRYKISKSITQEDKMGVLWEVPIFTHNVSIMRKLYFQALKRIKGLEMRPQGCKGSAVATINKSKFQKIKDVISQQRTMFTYSDAISSEEMIYFARRALKLAAKQDKITPIVAISHPKSFANEKELEKLMNWLDKQNNVTFSNYRLAL